MGLLLVHNFLPLDAASRRFGGPRAPSACGICLLALALTEKTSHTVSVSSARRGFAGRGSVCRSFWCQTPSEDTLQLTWRTNTRHPRGRHRITKYFATAGSAGATSPSHRLARGGQRQHPRLPSTNSLVVPGWLPCASLSTGGVSVSLACAR